MATAALNTRIEGEQHVRSPNTNDPKPSESGFVVTTRIDEFSPPIPASSSLLDRNLGLIQDTTHPVLIGGGNVIGDSCTPPPLPSPHLNPTWHTNGPLDPSTTTDPREQAWQRLMSSTVPNDELPSLIETIFSGSMTDMVDRLQGTDAQVFIDVIDEALDSLTLTSGTRRNCVKSLYKTCAHHSLYPRSLQIAACYDPADVPYSHGGYADVWKGEYRGVEVGVKVLRTYVTSDLKKITHAFCKEFVTWKTLCHPNVLPLLGVMMTENRFAMVSEWMMNGNINQFLRAHSDANRFELLGDVARGLTYMHSQRMVHGDLKGANILVDKTCHARLADFGFISIVSDSTTSNSYTQGGTTRWMSPELLDSEIQDRHPTTRSDCYALGMVIYEVLSGRIPFYQYRNIDIPRKVVGGDRPERPQGVEGNWFVGAGEVWGVLERCWMPQPGDRLSIEDVLRCLEECSRSWTPPSRPPADIWELSGVVTTQSTEWSEVAPSSQVALSQPPEKPDLERSLRNVNGVPPDYPGECTSLHANDPLPTQDLLRKDIGGAGMEPNDLGSGDGRADTFTELTAQPNAKPTAGGANGPATDDVYFESDIATHNPLSVAQPSQWKTFNATSPLVHHQDVGMAGDMDDVSIPLTKGMPRTEEGVNGGGRVIHQQIERSRVPEAPANPPTQNRDNLPPWLIDDLAPFASRLDGLRADQDPDDLSRALRDASDQDMLYNLYIFSLGGDTERMKALLEIFDKALQATKYDDAVSKRFQQLCGWVGLLPTSYTIPEKLVQQAAEQPVASGAFSDVWEGIRNGELVAVKALRIFKEDDIQKAKKVFCEEVATWRRVSHPNVVPFLGVSGVYAPLCVVSEWMPNGNVRDYVGKNPETSRLQLLLDISRGLSFLHSFEIVHGDLRGDNVLVDQSGFARLSDFGLARITSLSFMGAPASRFKGSQRWMAPELFNINNGEFGPPTHGSDIFALGMVTLEVFTGQVPFPKDKSLAIVMKRIIDDERPPRPRRGRKLGLSDEFWGIIQSSLVQEVTERPSVSVFVDFLGRATPDIAVLKELARFDPNSEEHSKKLHHMFECGNNTLFGMREEETLIAIEVFDQVLSSSLNDSMLRSQCLYGLRKVSTQCGLLPKSYWISHSGLTEVNDASPAPGRVSSTRQSPMDGKSVAVKTISPDCIENFDAFKYRLCTNVVVWKRLQHPNVVSFLGLGSDCPPISLVYPWMFNGNLTTYVRAHPSVNKLGLLLDAVRGLTYLHRYHLVHGNLTGHNILVDNNGVACISEYGLEIILRDQAPLKSIPINVRWMAPEVLSTTDRYIPSGDGGKAADIYSFAMVMFETSTGTTPFSDESDEEIIDMVATGVRPRWPLNSSSKWLREQVEVCWNQEPNERPTAFNVLKALVVPGEAWRQDTMSSAEDQVAAGGQEHVKNYPQDVFLTPEHSGHYDYNLSGHRLTSDLMPQDYGVSGTHNQSGPKRRFGKKIEKRIRSILTLPRHVLGETIGKHKVAVEKPTSGTEHIAQRKEEVVVCDGRVPYVVSPPIPGGKKLRKVVITIVSKDQGWSNYLEDYGTYRNSCTWFELSLGSRSKDSEDKWCGLVVRNLHAHGNFKKHTVEMVDKELYGRAESGDVLTVWALARSTGWKNTVKKVKLRYCVG